MHIVIGLSYGMVSRFTHAFPEIQRKAGPANASPSGADCSGAGSRHFFTVACCSAHFPFLHCPIFGLQKQDCMIFSVQVKVMPLKELLDPQGKAVMGGLQNLGN